MSKTSKNGIWSENKKLAALSMAEGTKTQTDIAKRLDIRDETISRWKRDPEFIKKIDEITLTLERHTVAGMLRRLDQKQEETAIGKNEWLKIEEFKAKLQGYDKTKVEHIGEVTHTLKVRYEDPPKPDE